MKKQSIEFTSTGFLNVLLFRLQGRAWSDLSLEEQWLLVAIGKELEKRNNQ
jgi:hypothetical protein